MSDPDIDVLILGASFAGVEVLYQLLRLGHGRVPKTMVVDRQAQHGYLPLVQEQFTGVLAPEASRLDTASYVSSIRGAEFVQDEVEALDPETKTVRLGSGRRVRARFIVVALGSEVNPPAVIDGAEHLLPYKSMGQFETARRALIDHLTRPDATPHVAVVGGGVSGVELAGELGALARRRPEGWAAPKVTLVDSQPRLLSGFSPRVGRKVEGALADQGVQLRLGTRVIRAEAGRLVLEGPDDGEVPCELAFWAGGIRPAPVLDALKLPTTSEGWLAVGPTLQCFATPKPTNSDIFACGDAVRIQSGQGQWNTMPRAIEAIWQAKVVAKNLMRLLPEPADYPEGVPPLHPHRLRETFFYGVSAGATSLVVYRGCYLGIPGFNHWFRRWLMRKYFERYQPLPSGEGVSNAPRRVEPASSEKHRGGPA